MSANKLIFKKPSDDKDNLLESQKKDIAKLYEQWANDIGKKAESYKLKTTPSSTLSEKQFKTLQAQLKAAGKNISKEAEEKIKNNIYIAADNVVSANNDWLKAMGFSGDGVETAFSNVADDIVRKLVTGQIYDSGWSLSKSIWSDNEQTQKQLYEIIAGGKAQNKSIYEIAKDLEKYVSPSKAKPWNLKDKDGKRIYPKQVDYNAQRLARTLIQHGYQQSFVETTKDNPLITEYIWDANGPRRCQICIDRDGKHYKKDQLPMDHPNGMCTMVPEVADDMNKQLADWFKADDGEYPEIDKFASQFGYKPESKKSLPDFINKYGKSGKTPDAWFGSLSASQKEEAKKLKESSGLTWKKWYESYIYDSRLAKVKKIKSNKLDVSDFISKMKNNTEENMLALEDLNFSKLSQKEKDALAKYTGNYYKTINSYLRDPKHFAERYSDSEIEYVKEQISLINKALHKTKLKEDLYVRRGTDYGDLAGLFMDGDFNKNKRLLRNKSAEELNDMFANKVGEYLGFTSTSSLYDRGFSEDVEIIMKLNKGASASSIMSISNFGTSEGETLLNAGSKVKCLKIEKAKTGHMDSTITVYLEVFA